MYQVRAFLLTLSVRHIRIMLLALFVSLLTVGCQVVPDDCVAGDLSCSPGVTALAISDLSGDGVECGSLIAGTIQGCQELSLSGTVTTVANVSNPYGIAIDRDSLYVADVANRLILGIDPDSGQQATLAGTGGEFGAALRQLSSDGTFVYVADANAHIIQKMEIATGTVTILAGSGAASYADDIGTAAAFNFPQGVTVLGNTVYVADGVNVSLRSIDLTTLQTATPAGLQGQPSNTVDGVGADARFSNSINGMTILGNDLYVTQGNLNNIRKVDLTTFEVTTPYGDGSAATTDGFGTGAQFNNPIGITTDGFNLYVAELTGNAIRKIDLDTTEVTTVASSTVGTFADGVNGFNVPRALATDGLYLYLTDGMNNLVRRIE